METNPWQADSGINIRELVWGLLTVADAYTTTDSDEEIAVKMLISDGEAFLQATEN